MAKRKHEDEDDKTSKRQRFTSRWLSGSSIEDRYRSLAENHTWQVVHPDTEGRFVYPISTGTGKIANLSCGISVLISCFGWDIGKGALTVVHPPVCPYQGPACTGFPDQGQIANYYLRMHRLVVFYLVPGADQAAALILEYRGMCGFYMHGCTFGMPRFYVSEQDMMTQMCTTKQDRLYGYSAADWTPVATGDCSLCGLLPCVHYNAVAPFPWSM